MCRINLNLFLKAISQRGILDTNQLVKVSNHNLCLVYRIHRLQNQVLGQHQIVTTSKE